MFQLRQRPRPRLGRQLIVPGALFTYGLITKNGQKSDSCLNAEMREGLREEFPRFHTGIDDYSRHAPLAAAYLLRLAGAKGRRSTLNFIWTAVGGHYLNKSLTGQLKRIAAKCRPGSTTDHSSFPSAHTSQAFFTATLLHEQYRRQSPWINVGAHAVATATGAMRMLNERPWLSDVAAGAGVGIFSAEVAWYLYPWLQKRIKAPFAMKVMVMPLVGVHTAVLSVTLRPD